MTFPGFGVDIDGSLSARRAWIEMSLLMYPRKYGIVALRKESVDRNFCYFGGANIDVRSLSARRAWIEIIIALTVPAATPRSLSARRAWIEICNVPQPGVVVKCRSPQGERG